MLTWLDRANRDVQAVRPRGDRTGRRPACSAPARRTGRTRSACTGSPSSKSTAPACCVRGLEALDGTPVVDLKPPLGAPSPNADRGGEGRRRSAAPSQRSWHGARRRSRSWARCREVGRAVVKSQSAATRRPAGVQVVDEAGDERDDGRRRATSPVASMSTVDGQSRWCGPPVRSGLRRTSTVKPGTRKTSRWSPGPRMRATTLATAWPGRGVDVERAPAVGGGHGTRNHGSLSNIPPRLMIGEIDLAVEVGLQRGAQRRQPGVPGEDAAAGHRVGHGPRWTRSPKKSSISRS